MDSDYANSHVNWSARDGPPDVPDPPEDCPSCHAANYDEETDTELHPQWYPFCSEACQHTYNEEEKVRAKAEAELWETETELWKKEGEQFL